MENNNGFTLSEVIKEYPELLKDPKYSEYGFAAESIFEMIAKQFKNKLNLKIERNNKINKYAVDFRAVDLKNNIIKYHVDIEGDHTHAFLNDGTFKWWDLTIPREKKHFFNKKEPFYYIKYSGDFKWCYVIDGWAIRDSLEETEQPRHGGKIKRKLLTIKSNIVFNKKNPYGIHRVPIQDWVKCIVFFEKRRNILKSLIKRKQMKLI